jgi:hypothetical protein
MKKIENIAYGEHEEQRLDLYLPEGDGFSAFIYFHGGGFEKRGADKTKGQLMAEYLAQKGIAVVCAEYRKYPQAAYPDFLRDAAAAVGWTYENITRYGGCGKLFIGGSSAGGYTSMMLCFDKRWLAAYRLPEDAIGGYFHDAGQPTVHFNVLRERGRDPRRIVVDEAAPIYHIGEAEAYPPMHFVISDEDIPCRFEQTMLTIATLRHFGYDMSKVSYQVVQGKHTEYVRAADSDGESLYGKMIYDFLSPLCF